MSTPRSTVKKTPRARAIAYSIRHTNMWDARGSCEDAWVAGYRAARKEFKQCRVRTKR